MKTRELLFAAIGLALGLVVGVLVISMTAANISAEDVRAIVAEENAALQSAIVSSVTTAAPDQSAVMQAQRRGDNELVESAFFLVTMEQAAEWYAALAEGSESIAPETVEELTAALLTANTISNSADLELYFDEQVNSAEGVLADVYSALRTQLGDEEGVEVCLGLDNDPYSLSGPVIYLYLQVPDAVVEGDALPKDWELLDGPREESMLWSAECYDPEAVVEEGA